MMSGPGHAGDMPNLHVPASGALDLEVLNTSITLDKDKPNSVFHAGGTAIVIHVGKDDYTSDPAGNAGGQRLIGADGESKKMYVVLPPADDLLLGGLNWRNQPNISSVVSGAFCRTR